MHFDLQHAVYYGELECDDVAVLGLHCLYSELIFVDQNRIKETRIEIILMNELKFGAHGDLSFYQK